MGGSKFASRKTGGTSAIQSDLPWVNWIKGIAFIWIFIDHCVETQYGNTPFGNPGQGWFHLSNQISKLFPITGLGLWTIPDNIWRYIGWLGDQGVGLFIIMSGFGLTWGLLAKHQEQLETSKFYQRRLVRLYPMWWSLHIIALAATYITGLQLGISIHDPNFYLSFIGFRATPSTFYYFSLAWWYVGLLIQLYLIYPFLWFLLKHIGATRLLLLSIVLGFVARFAVILSGINVGINLTGAIFVTRLPEFVMGICFAAWLADHQAKVNQLVTSYPFLLGSILLYICGTFLSFTWAGMVVSPFFVTVGASGFLYSLFSKSKIKPTNFAMSALAWLGIHSYALYLVHFTLIERLVTINPVWGTVLSIFLTVVTAIVLEKGVELLTNSLGNLFGKYGTNGALIRLALAGVSIYLCAVIIEIGVETLDPQEVQGWGERPSLAPQSTFGWYLIPNKTTHLRWETYDYYMTSNNLGFPGPSYPVEKAPGTIRIMTFGDAFTSAEGVNTNQSWPRLLDEELTELLPNHTVQVMNFAITGYGPNQYAEVAKTYIPIYKPDIVIVGYYMNDFSDALRTNDDFLSEIGFGKPENTGWYSAIRLSNARSLFSKTVHRLVNQIRNKPDFGEYSGAQFLLRAKQPYEDGAGIVSERLQEIKELADENNAKMLMFMIPVPVQVCNANQVSYYPTGYNLADTTVFDLDKPQRLAAEIASNLGIKDYDLRTPLKALNECPYQPNNLHWTVDGHKAVADYIANVLLANGDIANK